MANHPKMLKTVSFMTWSLKVFDGQSIVFFIIDYITVSGRLIYQLIQIASLMMILKPTMVETHFFGVIHFKARQYYIRYGV